MHGGPSLARPGHLRFQVLPGGELSTDLTLWQLQQQRGEGTWGCAHVIEGEEPRALADDAAMQPVQHLIALMFVDLDVAGGVESYGPTTPPIGPEAQGDLLGHGPAGQEDRCLLAQEGRDVALEFLDECARAVPIGLLVGADLFRQIGQDRSRLPWPVAGQEALAPVERILVRRISQTRYRCSPQPAGVRAHMRPGSSSPTGPARILPRVQPHDAYRSIYEPAWLGIITWVQGEYPRGAPPQDADAWWRVRCLRRHVAWRCV